MVILITGASHTGKTLLAQRLLEKLNYPYLSIDHIKMGLIRSGCTSLTPCDDSELTDYLWPIVREIIKTAIENSQNLIVEGCYVPFDWRKSFDESYLSNIRFVCLAMTDRYIDEHLGSIRDHACDIESRLSCGQLDAEAIKEENRAYISGFGEDHITLIDRDYMQTINAVIDKIGNETMKKIKGIVFDIGQTLVDYSAPLTWEGLYRTAFEHIEKKSGLHITEEEYDHFAKTLIKYNTSANPREREISSDTVFKEILGGTNVPMEYIDDVKDAFFGYFREAAHVFPEAEEVLIELASRGIKTGTLSDVPYGMDNKYVYEDLGPLLKHIDLPYTSIDTGYRKPSPKGLQLLAEKMDVSIDELAFVGDEDKDMECARNAGAIAILINRTDEKCEYGQDLEISSLKELLDTVL
ncbi:MAG: HAD-IA family hydrolase [Clostridia bacterium]|nr:HAD-IA family hydrolase [Clostridia bacterium]